MTEITINTFSLSNKRASSGIVPNADQHASADELLAKCSSTSAAIRLLRVELGWSTSAICKKLRTADNKPIPPQFVNNVMQRHNKGEAKRGK